MVPQSTRLLTIARTINNVKMLDTMSMGNNVQAQVGTVNRREGLLEEITTGVPV